MLYIGTKNVVSNAVTINALSFGEKEKKNGKLITKTFMI